MGDVTEKEHLLEVIENLVKQSCPNDSMAITAYAEAMRLLAKEGRCTILQDHGRRVIVAWGEKEHTETVNTGN